MRWARSPNRIVIQFCTAVDIGDVVISMPILSGSVQPFLDAGVEFQVYPLTFNVVFITL